MRLLDIARSAYVKSPPRLRRSIAPLISIVPVRALYGSVYEQWRGDIARSRHDVAFSAQRTEDALAALLGKAHRSSVFYRRRLEDAFGRRFDAGSVRPEDLHSLPILTKKDLMRAGAAALTEPVKKLVRNCTSGSNGEEPFAFYVDRDRSVREFAFVNDVWSRTGYTPHDTRCVLKGFRMKGAEDRLFEWEPALRELRISVFPMNRDDVELYLDLIDQRQIRFLHGYPSALEVFCRHLIRLGRRPRTQIEGILPISEPLYPHQRALMRSVFGDQIVFAPFYGLSEKALFAAEVPGLEDTYEFEPLYGLAELVDDDGVAITSPGTEGRLVGTGFVSSGMPFIRYDTQDRATLVEAGSRANGWRMRVMDIMPRRKPSYFIGASGNRIVATNFPPQDPQFFRGISEFQFYQDAPGESVIRYILAPEGALADAERIRRDLETKAQGHLRFTLQQVQCLASGLQGKRAFIEQRLDLSAF